MCQETHASSAPECKFSILHSSSFDRELVGTAYISIDDRYARKSPTAWETLGVDPVAKGNEECLVCHMR